jgi:hypothetical protein
MDMTLGDVHFFTGLVAMKLCKKGEDKTELGPQDFEDLSRELLYKGTGLQESS